MVISHTFFCQLLNFFSKINFFEIPSVSNSLEPDQALHFIRSNLGPNYSQKLLAYDSSRQRVNTFTAILAIKSSLPSAALFWKPISFIFESSIPYINQSTKVKKYIYTSILHLTNCLKLSIEHLCIIYLVTSFIICHHV